MSTLSDVRVLEFAGEIGSYAGKLYAELGADVIHIEPPEGDPVRFEWPFYKDMPNRETSLKYLYQNTNKRDLVLDIRKEEGKEIFLKLIKTVDILIESFPPGYLEQLGLGYEQLKKENPRLVHASITPFGQEGPYRDYPASDLTLAALGGFLYLAGAGDDKPARAYGEQSYMQGMMYAAVGTMAALYDAEETGEGQFIDVSMQACVATALEFAAQQWDLEKTIRRAGAGVWAGTGVYRCKDGYVYTMFTMGNNAYLWDPLPKWLKDEGEEEGAAILGTEEWRKLEYKTTDEAKKIFREIFGRFAAKHEKLYLYEESQRRRCVCYPISDPKDVYENPQLNYRRFFIPLHHEHLGGEVYYPGQTCYIEKMPYEIKPAPTFGQHTKEILEELGYSSEQVEALKERGVIVG
ncbi:MAG TPA: acyl-CoA hydratase [Desulfotomaculum sp.]|nr:acyl-CoA hydratase [Desulfotomaculum sp.]